MNNGLLQGLFSTGIMAPAGLSRSYVEIFMATVVGHSEEELEVIRGGSLSSEEKEKRSLRLKNILDEFAKLKKLYQENPDEYGLQLKMMNLINKIQSPEDLIQAELDSPVTAETIQEDLFKASRAGNVDLINKALDQGAKINQVDSGGYFVVHYAASSKKDEALKFLEGKGADLHSVDPKGNNLLHYYVGTTKDYPNIPMLEYLIGKGLNPNQVNNIPEGNGETPLSYMITRDAFYFHEESEPFKERSNELEEEYYIPVVNLLLRAGATADKYDLYNMIKFGYFNCARIIIDQCNIPVETAMTDSESSFGATVYKVKYALFTGEEDNLSSHEADILTISKYYGGAPSLSNTGMGYLIIDRVTCKVLDSAVKLADLKAFRAIAEIVPVNAQLFEEGGSDVVNAEGVAVRAESFENAPVACEVGDQRADKGYELSFSHGVAAEYIFVKPSLAYLSDSITGKNSEKTVVDYFVKDNFSIKSIALTLTNAATFTAAISTGFSPVNAVITTKLLSDLLFNPLEEGKILSSEYALPVLGCVMKSFVHFAVVHYTQVYNHPNKFVAGVLTSATSTALQLGYDLAEHGYQQMMGESSEVVE